MTSNDRLRRNLKILMKKKGLTQREMERMSKGLITQAGISFILSGKNIAKLDTLDELSRLLKCKPEELIRK